MHDEALVNVAYSLCNPGKDTPDGTRLTHLLRLNVTRPNPHAISSVDTPPVTDIDYSSAAFDTEGSDFEIVSERDAISEADELESRGLDGSGDGEIINIHPDTGGESDAESVSSAGRAGMDSSIEGLENRTRLLSIDYQGNGSGVGHRSRLATRARTSMLPRRAFRAASSPSPIRRFPPPRTEPAFPRARPPTQEPSLAFWTFVFS
ncbi:hypothetical protein BOTBODRAFT_26257 [Botryobasidium botryosum FD-172 SS1]|uniref:Uncharacterized protein n=1 Tax=Botryobasidium botryosum (strain FD-172 SS1) TaxID=930990 RepID=A0A067N207_BOTB1|nr:hypothetical protein BOTBODRAFT_26257 [Botryobasidium botryosum FD-172 SS1]